MSKWKIIAGAALALGIASTVMAIPRLDIGRVYANGHESKIGAAEAEVLYLRANSAKICLERLGAGVWSLHGIEDKPTNARVKSNRNSKSVSLTAGSGGETEADRSRLAAEYKRLGRSPELFETIMQASSRDGFDRRRIAC